MSRYSVFVPSFPQVVSVYTSPFVRVVLVCLPLSVFVSLSLPCLMHIPLFLQGPF